MKKRIVLLAVVLLCGNAFAENTVGGIGNNKDKVIKNEKKQTTVSTEIEQMEMMIRAPVFIEGGKEYFIFNCGTKDKVKWCVAPR